MILSSPTDRVIKAQTQPMLFDPLASRQVVVDFSGGHLSSDGGALLLSQIDRGLGVSRLLAQCFSDYRDQRWVDHSVQELVAQRLQALALGYEDLNDHNHLRQDPLLAVAVGKADPFGKDRLLPQHQDCALAASSTLNRLELSNSKNSRGHKLPHDPQKVQDCVLQLGVRSLPKQAREIILDLDAMGHIVHGLQEGRHFSAYYDEYCYLPLYIVAGSVVLWAQLRPGDVDPLSGVVEAVETVVRAIRKRCGRARIIVRGDSGFCRDELMSWCESQSEVYYCLGLGRNSVLLKMLQPSLTDARMRWCLAGAQSTRVFQELRYRTQKTWSCERRVVGKAEVSAQGDNPRFVVTSLPEGSFLEDEDQQRFATARLYEELYCGRGDMENVLKQQVLDLKADRMSTHHLISNQLRLWFSTLAYLLVERLREP
jgi:hypothetical protein